MFLGGPLPYELLCVFLVEALTEVKDGFSQILITHEVELEVAFYPSVKVYAQKQVTKLIRLQLKFFCEEAPGSPCIVIIFKDYPELEAFFIQDLEHTDTHRWDFMAFYYGICRH